MFSHWLWCIDTSGWLTRWANFHINSYTASQHSCSASCSSPVLYCCLFVLPKGQLKNFWIKHDSVFSSAHSIIIIYFVSTVLHHFSFHFITYQYCLFILCIHITHLPVIMFIHLPFSFVIYLLCPPFEIYVFSFSFILYFLRNLGLNEHILLLSLLSVCHSLPFLFLTSLPSYQSLALIINHFLQMWMASKKKATQRVAMNFKK